MPDQAPQTPNHYFCCTCHVIFDEHCDECKPLCVPTTTQGDDELRKLLDPAKRRAVTLFKNDHDDGDTAIYQFISEIVPIIQAEISTQREQARREVRRLRQDERDMYQSMCGCPMCTFHCEAYAIAAQRKEDKKGEN